MAEDLKKVKTAEFFNNLESIVRGRVKYKPLHQNPPIHKINNNCIIRRKRKRNRKKEKKGELRKIADIDKNFNKCGFKSNIEVVNNLDVVSSLREDWPSSHPLSNITDVDASVTALIEEIRTMNVGENLVPNNKWQSFHLLRVILRKLVKRHQKAPYKYMAWHYASRHSHGMKNKMDDSKERLPCKRRNQSDDDERRSEGLGQNKMDDSQERLPCKRRNQSNDDDERRSEGLSQNKMDDSKERMPCKRRNQSDDDERRSEGLGQNKMDDSQERLPCKRLNQSNDDESRSEGLSQNSDLVFLKFANGTPMENTQAIDMGNNFDKAMHPQEVQQFLNSCVQHSIPRDFFGCAHNYRIFMTRWLSLLIGVPGRKSISLGNLMRGVQISKVPWTTDASPIGGRGQRACVLAKAWLWFLLKYIAVILSCHYVLVVTSGESVGGRPNAFFAKRIWQSMKYSTIRRHSENPDIGSTLKDTNGDVNKGWAITQMSSEEMEKIAKSKGYPLTSHLQLKPKRNSMRPFLRVRVTKEDYTRFKACIALLQYLTCRNRKRCPTRNITNDVHQAWEEMYQVKERTLKMADGTVKTDEPLFYAVNVDIKDAFGCVLHDKLCRFIKEKLEMAELKPETVLVLKTVKYSKKDRRGKVYFSFRDILMGFPIKVQNPETGTSGTKKSVQYTTNLEPFQVGDLYQFIERCIKFQTIKCGKTNYRLSRGLAQGSPLSPCLWNLYCDAMEDQHLLPNLSVSDNATKFSYLIRGMDDYLFLTEAREEAEWFMRRMMCGFPDYNVRINLSKTCATLSSVDAIKGIEEQQEVHSCIGVKFWGLVLNPTTLSVMADYGGSPGRDLTNVMNFFVLKKSKIMLETVSKVGRLKLSPFLLNAKYSGYEGVLCNIFRAALVQVAYFHAAVKVFLRPTGEKVKVKDPDHISSNDGSSCNASQESKYVVNKKVKGSVPNQNLLARLLLNNAHSLASMIIFTGKLHDLPKIPTRYAILWLAYRAYRTILGYQGGRYPGVLRGLKWLEKCVSKHVKDEEFLILQNVFYLCKKSGMCANQDK